MSSVTLENLTKIYGSEAVVRSISLTVEQGEFLSLLGPSGSGKTTTLSMIAGFTRVSEGRISFDRRNVTHLPPRDRELGMVFQNYAIFPHLDVFGNVAFPLTVRKVPKEEIARRVAEALEMVKLTGFEKRFARQLSGGQQQRVALARAIVAQPRIVLMDEPLGALDKNLRYHMQMEIKEISQRLDMTVIYVTHDQEEALTMSDRIAIMDDGGIAQMGTPREVYERPRNVFVARFLGEANLLPVRRVDGQLEGPGRCRLTAAGDHSSFRDGHLFVRPEKISLLPDSEPAGENQATGRVRHVAFLGNVVRTELELDGGDTLLCDAVNAPGFAIPKPGQSLWAAWPASAASLLRD